MIDQLVSGLRGLWKLSVGALRLLLIVSVLANAVLIWNIHQRTSALEQRAVEHDLERVRWDEQRKAELVALSEARTDVRRAVDAMIALAAQLPKERR